MVREGLVGLHEIQHSNVTVRAVELGTSDMISKPPLQLDRKRMICAPSRSRAKRTRAFFTMSGLVPFQSRINYRDSSQNRVGPSGPILDLGDPYRLW